MLTVAHTFSTVLVVDDVLVVVIDVVDELVVEVVTVVVVVVVHGSTHGSGTVAFSPAAARHTLRKRVVPGRAVKSRLYFTCVNPGRSVPPNAEM
jgi:hypothetical protein